MTLTLNNTNTLTADNIIIGGTELSLIYATKNEVGNNAQISTNTGDIAVLNTKQLQNFNNINAITTDLTNNYQTNTQLATNFCNKTEMDTTLTNYYTSAQIDTNLSSNYQNNTLLATNFYNKSEVDTLIAGAGGGGGYTDTQIDDKLNLKADLSLFTDNVSFFPVIDLSRPSILHQGLTIKNSTINVEPLEGLLFSNQFGAEADRDVAVFKNQTNYITMKGNKIKCYATSDDSVANLELNPDGDVVLNNNLLVSTTGADISRASGDTNYTLRVKDNQAIWEFRNRVFTCRNGSNENLGARMEIQNIGTGEVQIGTASTARVGIGAVPNSSYFLTVAGTSNFDVIRSATRLDLIGDLYTKGVGSDIVRPSATTDYTLRVRDNVATFEFRNNKFGRTNGQMVLQNDGDCELFVGTEGTARMGVGTAPNASYFLNVGGTSNFNDVRIATNLNLLGEQLLNTNARIFQRADAFNSLNVITTAQMNFSLQSDRTTDPTTGTIALQLDDTNGITINRAVVNNQTFNSIGNITAEASLNVWGDLLFQHSSGIKETLNGSDYDLDIRNGDTDRAINLIVGAIGSTPEISISEANVNLLGNLDITHSTVSTSERVKMDNPDADGLIFNSINGANILEVSSTGVYVNGTLDNSSDGRLKEDIKEVNSKTFVDMVKYIKPKEFKYIDRDEKHIGFIADDVLNSTMPKEWYNIVHKGSEGYLRMDYSKMVAPLWGCVQSLLSEVDDLKKELKKLKGEESPKAKAKAKAKSKN